MQKRWQTLLVQTVDDAREEAFRRDVDAKAVVFEIFALYLGHYYYKRVFQTQGAKALTLAAFGSLLGRIQAT